MPRTLKILAWTIGALLVLPVLFIALVVTVANLDWGRRVAERMTANLTGGKVVVTGLSGHFPADMRIARVEVREDQSPWLNDVDITFQWSPTLLTTQALQVELMQTCPVGH